MFDFVREVFETIFSNEAYTVLFEWLVVVPIAAIGFTVCFFGLLNELGFSFNRRTKVKCLGYAIGFTMVISAFSRSLLLLHSL